MAEIGVVRFAHVAHEVAEAALPRYRSPFSKHTFTHPTLLALLCLMRYEDWTYREAEVRLRKHADHEQRVSHNALAPYGGQVTILLSRL
jgi:hypothetical protein